MTAPLITSPLIASYSPKVREQAIARRFVSRNGTGYLSVGIVDGRDPVDPVEGSIHLKVWFNDTTSTYDDERGDLIVNVDDVSGSDTVQREDVGKYYYELGPGHTQNRGVLHAEWTYEVAGKDFHYADDMQVLDQMPMFEALTEPNKLAVERVSFMFADLFDSTTGGPWLQEQYQTHFDWERIAQLMAFATDRFNLTGQPLTYYGVGIDSKQIEPYMQGVIVWGTYLEVVRHLIRSYTEQPDFRNQQTVYTDRRDYAARWQGVLSQEEEQWRRAVIKVKRRLLKLGQGSLLLAGGYFGSSSGGMFRYGMYAAQVRSFRFYPAAPAMAIGRAYGGGSMI